MLEAAAVSATEAPSFHRQLTEGLNGHAPSTAASRPIARNNPFPVFVIDDDPVVLKMISQLLATNGYEPHPFISAKEFLEKQGPDPRGCAVIDFAISELGGLELQQVLAHQAPDLQVIFLSGQANISATIRAMKAGAVDVLEKPVSAQHLLSAISRAAESDCRQRIERDAHCSVQSNLDRLTQREFEVLRHVIAGYLNKQTAWQLGVVEKTIKVHRSRMMKKMRVRTVAELVRLTVRVGLQPMAI